MKRLEVFSTLLLLSNRALGSMSWRCSSTSNEGLVANLRSHNIFTNKRVGEAMLAVDRGDFAPVGPYRDEPQRIGYNATISAPHMHAAALEHLQNHLAAGAKALDVGSGSGYLTACMAKMVTPNGTVVGIEHIPELVELSEKNIKKHHQDLLDSRNIVLVEGDGREGFAERGPYNAIHVGAAAKGLPKALIDQLAEGGRMMIPVEIATGDQVFMQIDKINGEIHKTDISGVIYVPLTSREEQWRRN